MKTREEIKNIIQEIINGTDIFLVDLKISKSNVIEVYVDAANGIDVGTCIKISGEVESRLNREEEDFELTVSSAGIGYPFKVPGQYRKNIGKEVEARLSDGTKIQGTLKSFDEKAVCIEYEEKITIEGKKKKELVKKEKTIALDEIKQIKDIVTF